MELKFLLFTLFVFFAAFGSIESTSWSSGRRSHNPARFNSTSAYRPWATVPPPRYRDGNYTTHYPLVNTTRYRPICTDRWNSTSPCRPFATIPPPINHGQTWNPSYPYPMYPHYPRPRHHTDPLQLNPAHLHQVYSAAGSPHSNSAAFNYGLYNHEGESNRGVGYITVTASSPTEKSIIPEYNRNSSSWIGQTYPSQIDHSG